MNCITAVETELNDVARAILKEHADRRVFGLYGEMGAGKTTLIKEFCKILGVNNITSSPSFAIVNEYHTIDGQYIYHFDFYRLNNPQEAAQIGLDDYLYSGAYCFIEWPEIVEPWLPDTMIKIKIENLNNLKRTFYY